LPTALPIEDILAFLKLVVLHKKTNKRLGPIQCQNKFLIRLLSNPFIYFKLNANILRAFLPGKAEAPETSGSVLTAMVLDALK
jgi:hypothetical protein